uniref:Uncharacterized protein n=1 Tax=Glossina palpalis gambiensis TaxID=67801 RepID=A0A1B0B0F4_9MUSC
TNACKHLQFGIRPHSLPIHTGVCVTLTSRIGVVFNMPTTTTKAEKLERTRNVHEKYITDGNSSSDGSSKIFNSPNSLECNSNCDLFYALKYNCRSKTFVLKLFFQFQFGGSGSGIGSGSGNGDGSSIHTLEVSSTFGARLHRTSV